MEDLDATDAPLTPQSDPAEADRLVAAYAAPVFRVAMNIVNDRHLAEDIVQETMFRAWRSLASVRDPAFERAWVLRIAHNTAVSLGRRRRDIVVDSDEFAESVTHLDPQRIDEGRRDLEALNRALDELDDRSRTIVVLRELEGLSLEEIGEVTGLPAPTVRTRLFRARRKLQKAVEES